MLSVIGELNAFGYWNSFGHIPVNAFGRIIMKCFLERFLAPKARLKEATISVRVLSLNIAGGLCIFLFVASVASVA